jgi:hypothetical protein
MITPICPNCEGKTYLTARYNYIGEAGKRSYWSCFKCRLETPQRRTHKKSWSDYLIERLSPKNENALSAKGEV